MALWAIKRGENSVRVTYYNLYSGQKFCCGEIDKIASDESILEWIVEKGKPDFGDRVMLSNGNSFMFMSPQGLAA